MELLTKMKEMIPWRRRPVDTHEVVTLRDDINRLFDRFFWSGFDSPWWPERAWWSGGDIEEQADEVIVRVEVPGIDPKELDVTFRDGALHIRAERESRSGNGGYREHRYGAMSRTVWLPEGLDVSGAKASCTHGLLTVRIPRLPEARERVHRIPVHG